MRDCLREQQNKHNSNITAHKIQSLWLAPEGCLLYAVRATSGLLDRPFSESTVPLHLWGASVSRWTLSNGFVKRRWQFPGVHTAAIQYMCLTAIMSYSPNMPSQRLFIWKYAHINNVYTAGTMAKTQNLSHQAGIRSSPSVITNTLFQKVLGRITYSAVWVESKYIYTWWDGNWYDSVPLLCWFWLG